MLSSDVMIKINRIRDKWYKPPRRYYGVKHIDFIYQSYKRSAIEEIKIYLMNHANQNPVDAVEDFRHMMDYFACKATKGYASFMFSVYCDVATDVIDVLLQG